MTGCMKDACRTNDDIRLRNRPIIQYERPNPIGELGRLDA